ncbi:MAG: hypothetical protein HRT35_02115 [Algicola sp.]|nr:hypothetical protein [Algicola sp.]
MTTNNWETAKSFWQKALHWSEQTNAMFNTYIKQAQQQIDDSLILLTLMPGTKAILAIYRTYRRHSAGASDTVILCP